MQMPRRELSGTHYEQGRALGSIYVKEPKFGRFKKDVESIQVDRKKLNGQVEVFRSFFPEYLDFIAGIAEGAKVCEERLAFHMIAKNVDRGCCTVFGVKTGEATLIARNFDWIREAADAAEVYASVFPARMERHSFVAVTDIEVEMDGRVMCPLLYHNPLDAINESGLYIGLTFSNYQNGYGFGIPTPKAIQLVAETCATVSEALEIFRLVPITNPKNFFIADRSGNMVVVEHTGGGSMEFRTLYPDESGMLGKANHLLHPDLAPMDDLPEGSTSFVRYESARNALKNAQGSITLEKMREIFLNPPVCRGMETPYPTIWSLFMDMGRGIYELVHGESRQSEEGILRIR